MVTKDYCSLHPEDGGPARAFLCEVPVERTDDKLIGLCHDVTKTERGMHLHLRYKHGIEIQGSLKLEPKSIETKELVETKALHENTLK